MHKFVAKDFKNFLNEREEEEVPDHGLSDEEAKALNRRLEDNLTEYQRVSLEIRKEQTELQKKLDDKHNELNVISYEIHDQMKILNVSTKKSDKVVAKLIRQYEKSSSMSYKKLWDKALESLNEENKKVLMNIQETSKVKHNIQEQFRIKVGESVASNVKDYITSKVKTFLKKAHSKMKMLTKNLKSIVKEKDKATDALSKLL